MNLFERIQLVSAATTVYGGQFYYIRRGLMADDKIHAIQATIAAAIFAIFASFFTAIFLFALAELFYWTATGSGF